jgi:uncharacterized protein involved in exopolysaccharide biosynthesis
LKSLSSYRSGTRRLCGERHRRSFLETNQEKRTGTSGKTNDFLQNRIAQLQSEVKAGEVKLVQLTKDARILNTDGDRTLV